MGMRQRNVEAHCKINPALFASLLFNQMYYSMAFAPHSILLCALRETGRVKKDGVTCIP